MPDPRVANCMFCDDIRAEVGNKTSLMGVYGGDIYFSTPLPILVPRFAVGVWLIADIDDTIQSMAVRILVPPNQIEIMRATIPVQQGIAHQEGATKFHTFAAIPLPPFTLSADGYMEVMVDTELGTLRAGRIMVHSSTDLAASA